MKKNEDHKTVLLNEAVDALHIENQAQYIDATLGAGGHTVEIVKRGGIVFAIESDEEMLKLAKKKLSEACPIPTQSGSYKLVHGNFKDIASIAREYNIHPRGILFDLGVSSIHYTNIKRGFTYNEDKQPLDMRLDPKKQEITAGMLLNILRQDQLVDLFSLAMPDGEARFMAKRVIKNRQIKKFETVGDLSPLIPAKNTRSKTHPATQVFMALRMAVNNELDNLGVALPDALEILESGGNLVVISFHSGEDRLVKEIFANFEKKSLGEEIMRVKPSSEEIASNHRSRSAVMRVFTKNGKSKK